jgi:6-phosphogluconolactonase/glucosamine-6-phosphate isomerase/deaminase
MIKWRRINTDDQAVSYMAGLITAHLDRGARVLWLVPGGSAADIAVPVSHQLNGRSGFDRLAVTLTDERFGEPGHKDSNWQRLIGNGFELRGAELWAVLGKKRLADAASDYEGNLKSLIKWADYSVALAGMGADGHIFGIKPGSPAVNSPRDVEGYMWDDYKRLTPTFNLLKKLDEVIVYAKGEDKRVQFESLKLEISPDEQPAQFLKRLKKVIILNDYKGKYL